MARIRKTPLSELIRQDREGPPTREEFEELKLRLSQLEGDLDSADGVFSRLDTQEENSFKLQRYVERIVIISLEGIKFFLHHSKTDGDPRRVDQYLIKVRNRVNNLVRLIKFKRSGSGKLGNRTISRRRK